MWYRDYYPRFPRSRPRAAKGGIKMQSKRGALGQSWWAKRWLAVLESFQIGARLGRGRSYARQGQVLSIDIENGLITAQVQGSRPKPYDVTIQVKALAPEAWKKLVQELSRLAVFAAKLLAGEMPQDIEQLFQKVGLSLFPEKLGDLTTDCSCPDWSNPCKHIAAVYYLLGEEFDRDPFLIFKLRGLSREELLERLGGTRQKSSTRRTTRKAAPVPVEKDERRAEPSLPDPAVFWAAGSLADDLIGEVQTPPVSAALPKRLGSFPFWRGQERFLDALEPIYRQASQRGLDVFLGERGNEGQALLPSTGAAIPQFPRLLISPLGTAFRIRQLLVIGFALRSCPRPWRRPDALRARYPAAPHARRAEQPVPAGRFHPGCRELSAAPSRFCPATLRQRL
jgi:uncharacterized Zn finger protein